MGFISRCKSREARIKWIADPFYLSEGAERHGRLQSGRAFFVQLNSWSGYQVVWN